MRPVPQLPGRAPAPLQGHERDRRQSPGCVCRIHLGADDQCLAPQKGHRPGCCGDFRPVRQRRPHGAVVCGAGRGRADNGRGPDRHHGGGGRPACRGAVCGHHRRERISPRSRPADGRDRGAQRRPRDVATGAGTIGDGRGIRRRFGDVRPTVRLRRHDRQHVSRRKNRGAGDSVRANADRLEQGRVQHADRERHLRPRDVRYLV